MQKNKIHFDILVLTACKHMCACTQMHTCAHKVCVCAGKANMKARKHSNIYKSITLNIHPKAPVQPCVI